MPVPTLDLGGGVGVNYDDGSATDFTDYGALVQRIFKDTGFNLGFDITPAELVTGFITENGIFKPEELVEVFK